MCKVVHFKKDPYDIYIGRLPYGKYNKWAYPKELRETFPEGTPRDIIVAAYEGYLLSKPELMADLHELKYKTLGCWCKNKIRPGETEARGKLCHGDILKKYVDKLEAADKALF